MGYLIPRIWYPRYMVNKREKKKKHTKNGDRNGCRRSKSEMEFFESPVPVIIILLQYV